MDATATDSDSGAGGGGEQASVFEDIVVNGAVEDGSDTSNPETGAEGVIPDVVAEGGETAAEDSSAKMDMLENLLKNPQMQEMVYPYLPENMRNPQTFEFMLNNPTYRKQLEDMLPSMGAVPNVPPDIEGAFQNVNPEAKAQFEALGTTPDELLAKLQSKPDLMQKMYNPKVMQAFMDMSKDPNNIQNVFKYQNDPEVWPVLMELTQLTQPGMGAPPGMGGS